MPDMDAENSLRRAHSKNSEISSRPLSKRALLTELCEWTEFDTQTHVSAYGDIPVFTNEFWTSKQRAAHSFHEVSYRACFKPQLPAFFINRLTEPGDLVFDPFMGRGTTLLEAALLGRDALGNDVNPLSRRLVEPRFAPPTLESIAARLAEIDLDADVAVPPDFDAFFEARTLRQICNLRAHLIARREAGADESTDRWIEMVAINRLTGHSKGFFSVYTLPPNQATSIERQRRINETRAQVPEYRDVTALILRKSRALMKDLASCVPMGRIEGFLNADLNRGLEYSGRKVRLSVTSPPFLNIVNYKGDNWMRCWFAGIDAGAVEITQTPKLDAWTALVENTLNIVAAMTEPGGWFAFEVGEIQKGRLRLEEVVADVAAATPWEPVCIMINSQEFTKTSNTWGVSNNAGGTNTNRIVVMQLGRY